MMYQDTADDFGCHPDSLDGVEYEAFTGKTTQCLSYGDLAERNADLETALAACQRELEQYRKQVKELLQFPGDIRH